MNLHRNSNARPPTTSASVDFVPPKPKMTEEELQEEYFASVFASCDALEQMAFIQEVTALKAGLIQLEDCEYTELVAGHFRRKQTEG